MSRGLVLLATGASVLALGACGVTGNLRFNPGFAELGSPGIGDTNREFALSLGPLPIMLARTIMAGDPEISGLLKGVRGVRVYTYEVNGDASRVNARMAETRTRLVEDGWYPAVAVREDDGLVDALVRMDGPERLKGLVVMVQDDEEIVLVNVIGNLKPETFAFAMDELDIDVPFMTVSLPPERQAGFADSGTGGIGTSASRHGNP